MIYVGYTFAVVGGLLAAASIAAAVIWFFCRAVANAQLRRMVRKAAFAGG